MKLVLGYGNPTRRDDGAGPALAALVEAQAWPGVEARQAQQLGPELAADFLEYERVVLVDASQGGPEADLRPVGPPDARRAGASHSTAPEVLAALAASLHGRRPDLWVCTLRGEDFDFGPEMSPPMAARMRAGLALIRDCLGVPSCTKEASPRRSSRPS